MKKLIVASIIIVSTVSISSVIIINKQNAIKICHSDILWIKENNTPDGLTLKTKNNIIVTNNNNGTINIHGYIKDNESTYRLDRAIYFNYNALDKKGNYTVSFTSASVAISDNTPNKLFENFIQLEKDKIKYYININRMNDDIYIVKDDAYTAFTCHIQK